MAAIKTRLKADLVQAMKARDEVAKSNIRMALVAIQYEEVAGKTARELTDAEEQAVLKREVNKRKDSADAYTQGNRPELAAKEAAEAEFLSAYLPAAMPDSELDALVDAAVAEATASLGEAPGMKQMGQIIKAVSAAAAGRADGKEIAAKVRARLAT